MNSQSALAAMEPEIRRLAEEGHTRSEIAAALGLSYSTLKGIAWRHGIEIRADNRGPRGAVYHREGRPQRDSLDRWPPGVQFANADTCDGGVLFRGLPEPNHSGCGCAALACTGSWVAGL